MQDIKDHGCADAGCPFQVRTAGLVDRRPYHSTPGTRQGDMMLTVFLDGRGMYSNSAGVLTVTGGMAGLVPPEDAGLLMAGREDPYLHYYCRFNGAYAFHLARGILDQRGARFFNVANADELADALRRIGHFHAAVLPSEMGRNEVILAQVLVMLRREEKASANRSLLHAGALRDYLMDHIDTPTDLSAIAAHFNVARETLCRKAQQLHGNTVLRLHERMKIDWACTLLAMHGLNVTDVAQRLGYQDPFYFSRVFKKHRGISPSQWRRNAEEKNV